MTILDSYGDGICCGYGNGSYTVGNNGVVYATGGQFQDDETTNFCVTASIDEQTLGGIRVYPNPSKGSFKVLSSEEVVAYSVVDLTGRKVVENTNMNAKHFAIDLSKETSGMYVLEITTHSGRSITRLIKE